MQTVTTGFSSPGRGRYIHPHEKRVVNIREAGRIQGFPDWYWQPALNLGFKRAYYNKVIGDAVPSLFAYPLMASLFA
jgi:DNA (cytosine-5)-methyltransferase 1